MAHDPFSRVEDAPLFIVPRVFEALRAFRAAPEVLDVPGVDTTAERARLDALTDRLLDGVAAHPTKFWVMKQFQATLEAVAGEDTGTRERVGRALEQLMAILGIESSDGVLDFYLGGIRQRQDC